MKSDHKNGLTSEWRGI